MGRQGVSQNAGVLVVLVVFSCDQAALWRVQSVCPSVTPFSLCSYIIVSSWNFQELLPMTEVRCMQNFKVKDQGHRGQNQLSRFWTVTPVLIDLWWWNDAQTLMLLRRGTLLFYKVGCQISRSDGSKKLSILTQIGRFSSVTPIWIHWWLWDYAQSLKQHRRGALSFFKVICQISRSCGTKITDFDPNWAFPDCNSSLNWHMVMNWCTKLDVAKEWGPIIFQGHPSHFKVTRLKKIVDFDPNWAFPDFHSSLNSPMALKWSTKLEAA